MKKRVRMQEDEESKLFERDMEIHYEGGEEEELPADDTEEVKEDDVQLSFKRGDSRDELPAQPPLQREVTF